MIYYNKYMKFKSLILLGATIFTFVSCGNNEPGLDPRRTEIVTRAQEELGKPYLWGAVGPDGYDASGLVCYCITGTHTRIGTVTTFLSYPEASNPLPGDICVNSATSGIYVSPGQMICAPAPGQSVCYSSILSDMIIVVGIQ